MARVVLEFASQNCEYATVRASKPSALVCAEAPEVEITRSLRDGQLVPYADSSRDTWQAIPSPSSVPAHKFSSSPQPVNADSDVKNAAIALGSNLGDRFANIELALRILETPGIHYNRLPVEAYITIIDTSFMYETEPMYVSDQPKFINCACLVRSYPKISNNY